MNSLVGYGVSSESEDEAESRSGAAKNEENESRPKLLRNFLLESGSASSESGSDSVSDDEQEEVCPPVCVSSSSKHPVPPSAGSVCYKLPPPALGGFCPVGGSSVFMNPFKEQAEEKLNALQKHVPLTPHAQPSHIGGKKVCVAYRKNGRCRFGIRCKFAHDSDLERSVTEPTASDSTDALTHTPSCREWAADGEEEEEIQSKKKKQRVGVSDSLIPPKRALKQYMAHRDNVSHTHMKTGRSKI